MFCLPSHTLKLKASDLLQSEGEESLLTHDITQLLVQRFIYVFHQNWKQLVFFQNILKSKAWPINSSKEEIVLSRGSKELFVQCFMKYFDQNWKRVEAGNQRTGMPADFTVLG